MRKESFDDESQVNYPILKAAMKVKATEALEEHQALSSLGEKFEASPENEESRLAEIDLLQNEIGDEPKEKKADKAKCMAANRKSLDRLSFLEEGTTKENLQADLKAAELVFLRKAKPIMMRESRASLMEAKRIAKTQEETVRTLKQKLENARHQETDKQLTAAQAEMRKAVRDLYKELGSYCSFTSDLRRDLSLCLCGDGNLKLKTLGPKFYSTITRLPNWIVAKNTSYSAASIKAFVDRVIEGAADGDIGELQDLSSEEAKFAFLEGLGSNQNMKLRCDGLLTRALIERNDGSHERAQKTLESLINLFYEGSRVEFAEWDGSNEKLFEGADETEDARIEKVVLDVCFGNRYDFSQVDPNLEELEELLAVEEDQEGVPLERFSSYM